MHDEPREWDRGEFLISTDPSGSTSTSCTAISSPTGRRGCRARPRAWIENSLISASITVGKSASPRDHGSRRRTRISPMSSCSRRIAGGDCRSGSWSAFWRTRISRGLRRFALFTRDAQGLYERYGFGAPRGTSTYLERWTPNVYEMSRGDDDWRTGPRESSAFHTDDERQWVAELECGHTIHMRHDPPWQQRPWVLTARRSSSE